MAYRNAPAYVKIGLWGVGTRATAMLYLWICVALALGLTYHFADPTALVLLLASLWYWLAVRWMDTNDGWRTKQR
jgi:hypothetical protein